MPIIMDRAQQLKDVRGHILLSIPLKDDCDGQFPSDSSSSSSSSDDDNCNIYSSDSDQEMFEEDDLGTLCDLYSVANSIRYYEDQGKCMKSREFAVNYFNHLHNADFRQLTRMDNTSFWTLVGLIEDHQVFQNDCPRKQFVVSVQLAATLDRLGHYGNGASLKRSGFLWGISSGSVIRCMHRCLEALKVALVDAVRWPDRAERTRISSEFAKKGFRKCVGLVDGTTLPLTQRPKIDSEVYFDRFPGTVSDIVCIEASPLWHFREDPRTFSDGQYLLGDSGYPGLLPSIVHAFKYSIAARDPDMEDFNFCVAKTRIANEHCIGILKSRWHSLKEIKTQLKGPRTSAWMVAQIECCVMLHNFVHDQKDEWRVEDDDLVLDDEDDVDAPDNVNIGKNEGLYLQQTVMEECLEYNRRPGGFL